MHNQKTTSITNVAVIKLKINSIVAIMSLIFTFSIDICTLYLIKASTKIIPNPSNHPALANAAGGE